MSREKLIEEICLEELRRVFGLSLAELSKELSDWFGDDIIVSPDSKDEEIEAYMLDFERYRMDEGEEELKERLSNY